MAEPTSLHGFRNNQSGFESVLIMFNPGDKGFLHEIAKTPLPSIEFASHVPEPIGKEISSGFLSINQYNAFQKVVEYETPDDTVVRRLEYFVEDQGGNIWYVKYFTEAITYDELFAIFEKSIQTIRFDLSV